MKLSGQLTKTVGWRVVEGPPWDENMNSWSQLARSMRATEPTRAPSARVGPVRKMTRLPIDSVSSPVTRWPVSESLPSGPRRTLG